jgi:uncharacterized protein YdeI (YjbR/CyaY-like superfamily)
MVDGARQVQDPADDEAGDTVVAADLAAWRSWLAAHGATATEIRLAIFHQGSTTSSVGYAEAVEHALCFGWVDSHASARDDESFYLRFSPRNPASTWSKINRERVERLTAAGQMMPAGQEMVDLAKRTGTWDPFPEADAGVIPDDLAEALAANPTAAAHFEAFPPSSRRLILRWIASAKRPPTRARRVAETAELAGRNIRANHPR